MSNSCFNGKQFSTAFYNGNFLSKCYVNENIVFDSSLVILTINPNLSDAIITFSNYGIGEISSDGKSIRIKKGSNVTYSVSKTGYVTQNNTITINTTQTLNIELQLNLVTLTINTTPSDATVTFNTGTVSGKTCTVPEGTLVSYTVSRQYYHSQTNSITVNNTQTINIALTTDYYVPEVNETIVNLAGSSKYDSNTQFIPGRYKVEVAPGVDSFKPNTTGTGTLTTNMEYIETITEPFIIRAYCGSDATYGIGLNGTAGTNPYEGNFKVNGIDARNINRNNYPHGIDVTHIFGAGGGNSRYYNSTSGSGAGTSYGGGANCLGNGNISMYNDYGDGTNNKWGGAGSCLHILPLNGTFGTDYLRAYHCAPLSGFPGGAYGGGYGRRDDYTSTGSFSSRGGNSPYGNGSASYYDRQTGQMVYQDTGIGGGGKIITLDGKEWFGGSAAYFDGTSWVDALNFNVLYQKDGVKLQNAKSSYIKITYLG